jgi:WD40 repeat protein
VLSGSSDKHVRLFNLESTLGWSTSSEFDAQAAVPLPVPPLLCEDSSEENTPLAICQNCGVNVGIVHPTQNRASNETPHRSRQQCAHTNLVRNVALGADFVVSGSYDFGVKVWDRKSGRLVTDLEGRHTGRIFSVGFDCTKVGQVKRFFVILRLIDTKGRVLWRGSGKKKCVTHLSRYSRALFSGLSGSVSGTLGMAWTLPL